MSATVSLIPLENNFNYFLGFILCLSVVSDHGCLQVARLLKEYGNEGEPNPVGIMRSGKQHGKWWLIRLAMLLSEPN